MEAGCEWQRASYSAGSFANVGENLTDLTLQNAADEIVQEHILNLFHRYAYPTERVFQFIELLQGQQIRRAIGQ